MIDTSHNPRTDHRGIIVLCGFFVLSVISILGAFGAFSFDSNSAYRYNVQKAFEYDGCTVYSFDIDTGFLTKETAYLARCNNGKAATTLPDGTKLITEPVK